MRRRTFLGSSLASVMPRHMWRTHSDAATADPERSSVGIDAGVISIVYNARSSAETAAGQELQKFIRQMTGTNPGLWEDGKAPEATRGSVSFQVGRTRATTKLISSGAISDPGAKHSEAYLIHSLEAGEGKQVIFLGGTGIATLYAVYHYLEKFCGIGFFFDGDRVPRRERVPVEGLNVSTQPHFGERMTMNLTLYWYSTPWWEWEDWEKYIDWTIKNRYNILSLWDTPGEDLVWNRVWRRFGVHISDNSYSGPPYGIFSPIKYGVRPPLTEGWREGQSELNRRIIQYARSRGMRTLAPAVSGIVPPEFLSAYPDARTFELSWTITSFPKQTYLHPSSPLYQEVGKAFLEEYLAMYGTDHLYWLENYLECDVHGAVDLQQEVRREIAGANFKILDEVDPQGIGILSSWAYQFTWASFYWTPDLVREHLDRVPPDRVRVLDQWCDILPLYKQMDYFYGRPWYFGVLHSPGGSTQLHGHMALLEDQCRQVTQDPRANRCVGFSPTEEALGHNYFYFQFVSKLAWNPSEVNLPSFTREYSVLRYGEKAAPSMTAALKELLASVYAIDNLNGTDSLTRPLYWSRLGSDMITFHFGVVEPTFVAHLRRALEHALEVEDDSIGNPLYRHDLNDIARQYLGELFNAHVLKLSVAQAEYDPAACEEEAKTLESLLAMVETLLSHDDHYWLSPTIKKAKGLPGAPPDIERRVREILTLWGGESLFRDYAARDYYELIKSYYRPRVLVYLQNVRQRMRLGQRQPYRSEELKGQYGPIENDWVDKGFPLVQASPEPERVAATVKEILKKFGP